MRSALYTPLALLFILFSAGCATVPVEQAIENPPAAGPLRSAPSAERPVIGIALGGGAARGFAHVGVLNALEDNGVHADIVVGTSAGSVVGALYAGGIRGDALVAAARQLDRKTLTDWIFPDRGVLHGQVLQDFINRKLHHRPIEALDEVFVAVATDLATGRMTAFTAGNTGMAVRASSTIPGFVQPVTIEGREYVDGGLVSQVPVQLARTLGADIVVAVDVSRKPLPAPQLDSALRIMHQALIIMSQRVKQAEIGEADVVVRPDVGEIAISDFELREQAMAAGYAAALQTLPEIKRLMRQKASEKKTTNGP